MINVLNKSIRFIIISMLLFISYSCIKEDLSNCATADEQALLYVKVIDAITGEDISHSDDVDFVDLFIFQPDGKFLDHQTVSTDTIRKGIPITIKSASTKDIWVSAWGNLKDNQNVSEITKDCFIEHLTVLLKMKDDGYAANPDDLFFGLKQLSNSTLVKTKAQVYSEIIPISRKNARMHITVRGLPDNDSYYFTICKQNNGYDFKGNPVNTAIDMRETGIFDKANDYHTPNAFNLIHVGSPDQCMTVNLHSSSLTKANNIIASVSTDSKGNLIAPNAGETTNILIDLTQGSEITVSMEITPWNVIYNWTTW